MQFKVIAMIFLKSLSLNITLISETFLSRDTTGDDLSNPFLLHTMYILWLVICNNGGGISSYFQ